MEHEFPVGYKAHCSSIQVESHQLNFASVISTRPCSAAAMFTRSRFAGPSVQLSQANMANASQIRGVLAISKNANVATGEQGAQNAREVISTVSEKFAVPEDALLLASTGVIGRQYPMQEMRAHLAGLSPASLVATVDDFAYAIMTTDTLPKVATSNIGDITIVGVAKGVGMIEPDMATMLAFIFTDAEVEPGALDQVFRHAVERTFNCLSIDSDTSTSDTAVVLANGAKGPVSRQAFAEGLHRVCLDLTEQIAADGEGATKVIRVEVKGARDFAQARRVGKAIVNSPLVKTAVHGCDPNWGRVAMAIGKCWDEADILPEKTSISFGSAQVYPGTSDDQVLSYVANIMAEKEVPIAVNLGIGLGEAVVFGCDLTEEYIRINADYTT